ncbi:Gfo/Idh/MocA family oxidoreductase [candidate division WOR-3 bacterium]|nr:Gfo/Idh/MocA family oxidoreductase [candidate division WOR-3 bacterium]
MTPLRIAVAGLGRWGLNYCRTLSRLPECRLVAAIDPCSEARAAAAPLLAAAPGCQLLSDLLDASDLSGAEAVVIATPEQTHFDLACRALQSGRHVLVEKPMATSAVDAASLLDLAGHLGRVLAVGHTSLYGPGYGSIRSTCGPAGVRAIAARRASRGLTRVAPTPLAVLWDLAPHDVAMAVALAGEPVGASCRPGPGPAVEYELRFPGGARMTGSAVWADLPVRSFAVSTAAGTFDAREPVDGTVPFDDLPLTRQCRDFISACHGGPAVLSDGRLGLATVRAIETLAAGLGGSQGR